METVRRGCGACGGMTGHGELGWPPRRWYGGLSEKGLCIATRPAKHKVHVLCQETAGAGEDQQGGRLATVEGPEAARVRSWGFS